MRWVASALFLLAHGLLVLEHIAIGTALHGIAEAGPWALRHRAWDLIVIGLIFCVLISGGRCASRASPELFTVGYPCNWLIQNPASCQEDQMNIARNTQFSQPGRRSFSNTLKISYYWILAAFQWLDKSWTRSTVVGQSIRCVSPLVATEQHKAENHSQG